MLVTPTPAVTRAAVFAATLRPWQRGALLVAIGALTAAALPPLHLIPTLWICFPLLLWAMDADPRPRGAFVAGWCFGAGHFATGLYWISHALLIEPWRHGWLVPFAIGGFGAGLGIFIGLATLAARLTAPAGPARVLALAATWTLQEWLRSWIFTGFPWNLMGTVWMPLEGMTQAAAVVGTYGLSLVTVAAATMPATLAWLPRRWATAWTVGMLAVLAAIWGAGALRLAAAASDTVPGVRVRLVQAGVEQALKWRDDMRLPHLRDHVALSRGPGFDAVTHVVWPESAAPFFLDLDTMHRGIAAEAAPPGGLLITGAVRRTPPGVEPLQVWNSLLAIDAAAQVAAVYDKVHLVPFGEYMPLRMILPAAVEKLTAGSVDFSAGAQRTTVTVPGTPPFTPLICYEIIFPANVVGPGQRPQWLVNATNDGWFGLSAGPHQHFASARMRAIEEGLPVARVANTGISAIIDPHGRVLGRLDLGARGVVDGDLPAALEPPPYARNGNVIPLGITVIILVGCFIATRTWRLFGNAGRTPVD